MNTIKLLHSIYNIVDMLNDNDRNLYEKYRNIDNAAPDCLPAAIAYLINDIENELIYDTNNKCIFSKRGVNNA